MSAKTIVFVCAQALLAQVALSACVYPGAQYLNAFSGPSAPCGAAGLNALSYGAGSIGCGAGIANGYSGAGINAASLAVAPTSGGALPVSSSSSIAPSGLAVSSENAFEGSLQVIGELPFLSAIALEGVLPSAGAGVVNYGCGNGVTAITNAGNAGAYGLGGAGIGYGAAGYGATGYGLGLGAIAPGAGLGLVGVNGCGCGC